MSKDEQKFLYACWILNEEKKNPDYCFDKVCIINGLAKIRSGLVRKICKSFAKAGDQSAGALGCFKGIMKNARKKATKKKTERQQTGGGPRPTGNTGEKTKINKTLPSGISNNKAVSTGKSDNKAAPKGKPKQKPTGAKTPSKGGRILAPPENNGNNQDGTSEVDTEQVVEAKDKDVKDKLKNMSQGRGLVNRASTKFI